MLTDTMDMDRKNIDAKENTFDTDKNCNKHFQINEHCNQDLLHPQIEYEPVKT